MGTCSGDSITLSASQPARFNKWFTDFGKAWASLDPKLAAGLFSKDAIYYESVFDKPYESQEDILKLWLVVPKNQKDVKFTLELLSVTGNLAVANWKLTRNILPGNTKQDIDSIFVIRLNEESLCNYFKQWRAVKQ